MQITHETSDTHEHVVSFHDDDFHCVIALHNTRLGPALGGCRLKPYQEPVQAMQDALRLSEAMTYKASLAGLSLGGGKAVISADRPTREVMRRFGEAVEYFKGDFIAAEDVGTTLTDLEWAGETTRHVLRLDGSEMTARGVLAAMHAGERHQGHWGATLNGVPIWVQGLGKVGMPLALSLVQMDHSNVYVTDMRDDLVAKAKQAGAYDLNETDRKFMAIYAPCALGQVVNAENVKRLTYSIICGAANNQLADETYADVLHHNAVLYLPDFLVNAGGVINGAFELAGDYDEKAAAAEVDAIGERVTNILQVANEENIPPLLAAMVWAKARL